MADAIRKAGSLDRSLCRATAGRRFSGERMIRDYFRLYRTCIQRGATLRRSLHA